MRLMLACVLLFGLSGCRTNESPEQQVNDIEITAEVKKKLAQDLGLQTVTNISVNSTNGVVTLSGQVGSEANKSKAGTAAQSVAKVARVNNNLQVTGTAR